jgi:L-ascorbate metabolism protein UlaG (beta-lactamase superfamily)
VFRNPVVLILFVICLAAAPVFGAQFATDRFPTEKGELAITFIGHGTLMFEWNGKVIHVDPVSEYADYTQLPKADLVFITHEHRDHLDAKALGAIRTPTTVVVLAAVCATQVQGGTVMSNGDVKTVEGVAVEAVPAYNLVHMRSAGVPYHPKGQGNGYIFTFGGLRVYVAGDTENTPEMKSVKNIDVAFLPMNLPFTMTPEMVAAAARAFQPRVLYPYHFGDTDTARLPALLKDTPEVEVRIRAMK